MRISDLPEVKHVMESGFAKLFPNATWAANELVTINGRKWIHFDFTSSVPRKSRSALYVTSFEGDQLQFLLQAEAEASQELWNSLQRCGSTLLVSE